MVNILPMVLFVRISLKNVSRMKAKKYKQDYPSGSEAALKNSVGK